MLAQIREAVLRGDMESVGGLTQKALKKGIEARRILEEALTPAMDQVGREYETGERYIPEMLISAEAMKVALTYLRPLLAEGGVDPRGTVVFGTVEGDLHDIGKDLVIMMLEGAGFHVHDLGVDVPASEFVDAVRQFRPTIVGMSALLSTTMVHMADVVKALSDAGVRDQVYIMVGGAPVSRAYAQEIGADEYAPDAAVAARVALQLASR